MFRICGYGVYRKEPNILLVLPHVFACVIGDYVLIMLLILQIFQ